MVSSPDDAIRRVTSELRDEFLIEQIDQEDTFYRPVPSTEGKGPLWRVRFELAFDSAIRLGLDIQGEVVLGRGSDEPGFVGLFGAYDTEQLGVSRRHALLRPTDTRLYILDLGSTNGTWLNGHSIGVNMPYSLTNGDHLKLGRLEFVVKIVRRPVGLTALLRTRADLAETLTIAARNITAQLDMHEVLKQAMDTAMSYTPADEVTLWLVDEQTGELFLEAGRGLHNEQIARLPVADSLAGRVIATGKPIRVNRPPEGDQIKLKTGYLVEAVIYVPLTVGGVTFGVLSAAHREPGKSFSDMDEKLLAAIGDFTALAVQNARLYQAAHRALKRHGKIITALNALLSHDLKSLLNATRGYCGLLSSYESAETEVTSIIQRILAQGDTMAHLVDQLIEVTGFSEDLDLRLVPCDLVEVVNQALGELAPAALRKRIALDFQVLGETYLIQGDPVYLRRSVSALVDNAIRFSPADERVPVALIYSPEEIILRVCDSGPGIREDLLPHLFEQYVRSAPSPDGQGGLGLGLELVRAAVEAHRGQVSVRNAEGRGAEFLVTFPSSLRVT